MCGLDGTKLTLHVQDSNMAVCVALTDLFLFCFSLISHRFLNDIFVLLSTSLTDIVFSSFMAQVNVITTVNTDHEDMIVSFFLIIFRQIIDFFFLSCSDYNESNCQFCQKWKIL